jgi:anti-sigma factor RsiW
VKNVFKLFRGGHRPDVVSLSAYLDRRLTANEAAVVETHVEGCAACREQLAGLRDVRAALRATSQVDAPRSFRLRVADVESRQAAGAPWASPLMRALPAVGVAAAAVFIVAVALDMLPADQGGSALTASRALESSDMLASQPAGGIAGDAGTQDSSGAEAYASSVPGPSAAAPNAPVDGGPESDTPPDGSGKASGDIAPNPAAPTVAPEAAPEGVTAASDATASERDDGVPWRVVAVVAGLIAVIAAGGYAGLRNRERGI